MEQVLFVDSYFAENMWYCPWNPKANIVNNIYKNNHHIRQVFIPNLMHDAAYSNSGYYIRYGTFILFGIPNGFIEGDGI